MSDDTASPKATGGLVRILIWLAVAALVLALLAAGAVYSGYRWMQHEFERPGPLAEETTTQLPRGAGLIRIATQMEGEGVISDARIFRYAVTLDGGDRALRAGEYRIPAGASMAQVYEIIRSGQTVQHAVTLAEGLTSAMIIAEIASADMLTGDAGDVPPEGSLLPETYLVDRGTSRAEVIARMRSAQDSLLDELWPNRAEDLPIESREEAIILASIVEKETGIASERDQVAAVFINRLRRGMRLESDPTIIYGISQPTLAADAVSAAALGLVEALVGALHEVGRVLDVLGPLGHADGDRDRDLGALEPEGRALDRAPELLGEVNRALERDLGHDHRELLAAGPRGHVVAAHLVAHQRAELAEHRVAREVAEGVVDLLEVIDVEEDQREAARVAAGAGGLALERLVEVALVVQLGEAVHRHQPVDLLVVLRLHVAAHDELEDRAADLELVAVAQDDLVDELVVDVGAVGRAEVADHVVGALSADPGVVAGHALLVELDVALGRAAEDRRLGAQRNPPSEVVPVDDHQATFA